MGKSIQARLRQKRPARQTIQGVAWEIKHAQDTAEFYGPEWRELRAQHIKLFPACVDCGKIHKSNHVDHIRPHKGNRSLLLDPSNLQTKCATHHNRKTAKNDGGFGNPRKQDK